MKEKKEKAIFITVPRSLMITWAVSFVCMLIMTVLSIQYANYTDSRSNQRWCGVVNLLVNAYERNPTPNETRQQLLNELYVLREDFHC